MASDVPNIAAASDLKFALEEITDAFTKQTGRKVNLVFGSSGNFARQIAQRAPFQVFLSADEKYVHDLAGAGFAKDQGTLYAVGRIALFTPHSSLVKADPGLEDLRRAIADGRLKRLAIANPDHAPYGRAAEQALRSQGLWNRVQSKLVFGENVSQAAQFATGGSAQAGIIAYSLALSPTVSKHGQYVLLPETWHEPLHQRMVLLQGAGDTARAFFAFVQKEPARIIFRRYGFLLPGEHS
jgi:molybdate transport system substrate-binding protein